jgi:hypothetical protein
MDVAIDVKKGLRYEVTFVPVEWVCPVCQSNNSTTFIEEEDLNRGFDNVERCYKCDKEITIKTKDIFPLTNLSL